MKTSSAMALFIAAALPLIGCLGYVMNLPSSATFDERDTDAIIDWSHAWDIRAENDVRVLGVGVSRCHARCHCAIACRSAAHKRATRPLGSASQT